MIQTSIGKAEYDYLVLAAGTTTNYFGNKHIEEEAMPMKMCQKRWDCETLFWLIWNER